MWSLSALFMLFLSVKASHALFSTMYSAECALWSAVNHIPVMNYLKAKTCPIIIFFCLMFSDCEEEWIHAYSFSFHLLFQGPFATFKLQADRDCDWTGLKFSPDGKLILLSTNGQTLRLVDAFQGGPLQTFMVSIKCQCSMYVYMRM